MTIRFKCPNPSCQKVLTVKDELAGKKAPCPACKTTLTIPRPKVSAPTGPAPAGPAQAGEKPRAPQKPKPPVAAPMAPPADVEALAAAALAGDAPPAAAKPEADGKAAPTEAQPIVFKCEFCETELKVPAEEAGKKIQCTNPDCRLLVKVPVPKVEKKDWRDVKQTGPSGARRAEPEKLVGVQGGEVKKVSQEALEEAGAIPDEEEPVTWGERIKFYALWIVLPAAVLVGGYLVLSNMLGRSAQKRALDAALADADPKAPKAGILRAAELQRGTAAFYLREGKAKIALEHFKVARSLLQQAQAEKAAAPERDLLLIQLALNQVDLGGDDAAQIDGVALPWDPDITNEVRQTVNQLGTQEGKAEAIRAVGWKLLQKKQEGSARTVTGQFDQDEALTPHVAALQFPTSQANQVKERFPPPEKGEEVQLPKRIAYAEGRAFEDKYPEARAAVQWPGGTLLDRVEALLAVAATALVQGKDDEARTTLDAAFKVEEQVNKAKKKLPPALREQATLIAARAGHANAKELAKALPDKSARAAAQLEMLRAALKGRTTVGDLKLLPDEFIQDRDTLSYALAVEAVARHNTRLGHSGDVQEAIDGLEENLRPFAHLGVALGLQDRAK
jgi:hypothetical protein